MNAQNSLKKPRIKDKSEFLFKFVETDFKIVFHTVLVIISQKLNIYILFYIQKMLLFGTLRCVCF